MIIWIFIRKWIEYVANLLCTAYSILYLKAIFSKNLHKWNILHIFSWHFFLLKNFFTLKINWPVSTSTLSGVPSILSTICEFKVCYQSCSLKRASFTLKAILIRVERVSTIRLRSGTVLVNLKYFDVIVLLLCITYIYQTRYFTYIIYWLIPFISNIAKWPKV